MPTYYLGLDVHKVRTQYCLMDPTGEILREGKVPTQEAAGPIADADTAVVLEATGSWHFAYDALVATGAMVKLAHPARVKAIASARIKTDKIDARILARLLRTDLIPEVVSESSVSSVAAFITSDGAAAPDFLDTGLCSIRVREKGLPLCHRTIRTSSRRVRCCPASAGASRASVRWLCACSRGEPIDALSRELGVEIYRLESWRDRALAGMDAGLKGARGRPGRRTAGRGHAPHRRVVDGE